MCFDIGSRHLGRLGQTTARIQNKEVYATFVFIYIMVYLFILFAGQFMRGGTMGWFTYQNQGGAFFDPANKARVSYIQMLSNARIIAKDWMVHGQ